MHYPALKNPQAVCDLFNTTQSQSSDCPVISAHELPLLIRFMAKNYCSENLEFLDDLIDLYRDLRLNKLDAPGLATAIQAIYRTYRFDAAGNAPDKAINLMHDELLMLDNAYQRANITQAEVKQLMNSIVLLIALDTIPRFRHQYATLLSRQATPSNSLDSLASSENKTSPETIRRQSKFSLKPLYQLTAKGKNRFNQMVGSYSQPNSQIALPALSDDNKARRSQSEPKLTSVGL